MLPYAVCLGKRKSRSETILSGRLSAHISGTRLVKVFACAWCCVARPHAGVASTLSPSPNAKHNRRQGLEPNSSAPRASTIELGLSGGSGGGCSCRGVMCQCRASCTSAAPSAIPTRKSHHGQGACAIFQNDVVMGHFLPCWACALP